MKLLHLRSSGGFYGAENVILQLAKRQQGPDITAAVAAIGDPCRKNELLDRCNRLNLDATLVPCRSMVDAAAVKTIRNLLKTGVVDILCTHDYKATVLGYLASLRLGLIRVSVNHLWDDIDAKLWLYQRAEGILYNRFDHIVAVSKPVAGDVRPLLWNKHKLTVISNGIDTGLYGHDEGPSTIRSDLELCDDDFVIGMVGRLAPQKGHSYLIEAAAALLPTYPRIKLVFWGEGPMEDVLKQQVRDLSLTESVRFAGVSDNMPAVYRAMDLFAMPSLSEGLPMALLEAMAAGRPVLATPVGDIPTLIDDGETGYLVPKQDAAGLARGIDAVIRQGTAEKTRIAENGRRRVRERFSADEMAAQYASLFQKLNNACHCR